MTQCEKVLRYMEEFGSITAKEANSVFGCMRLAARIGDLRKQGYEIERVMVKGKNRYGEPTDFASYSLAGSEAS